MKRVTVKVLDEKDEYILLENIDDVTKYFEFFDQDAERKIRQLCRSGEPVDRWDHMIRSGDGDTLVAAAICHSQITGESIATSIDPLMDSKKDSIVKTISEGNKVLINKNGGYCSFNPSSQNIIKEERINEVKFTDMDGSVVINKNTKYINLENDPVLESVARKYLEQVDPNYSYVVNLHRYSWSQLTEIFKKFIKNGGRVVYVYTTGMDVDQMRDYSRAIINAGIHYVEFHFNNEYNTAHKEIVQILEDNHVCVNVLNS